MYLSIYNCIFKRKKYNTEIDYDRIVRSLSNIQNVSNKIELDLRNNFMDWRIINAIVRLIEKNKLVKSFNLWMPGNQLDDNSASQIIRALQGLRSLEYLSINLEWNFALTNKTFKSLFVIIPTLQKLREIHIRISHKTFVHKSQKLKFIALVSELKNIKIAKYDCYNVLN